MFIGKSPKCKTTKFSEGYGRGFYGNSILLQIKNNKYVFIGQNIFEFTTNDTINYFTSPVGNNDVPYPLAIGDKNSYFMLDNTFVLNDNIEFTKEIKLDPYLYYYENIRSYEKSTPAKKMLNFKVVQKRL